MSEKRVAIVTGAGKGIGKAIALSLANAGRIPVLFDINEDNLKTTLAEITTIQPEASSYYVDISNVNQIDEAVHAVYEKYGRIDILVNNAGILNTTPVEDMTEQEWDLIFKINTKGTFFASKAVIPYMKAAQFGRIINISSNSGRAGGVSSGVAYGATKAAVIGITRSMAKKYADQGITVNTVAPGTIVSDIIKGFSEEELNALKEGVPTKRLGTVEEIAEAVVYLASDLAGFTTGATIDVNGGLFIG